MTEVIPQAAPVDAELDAILNRIGLPETDDKLRILLFGKPGQRKSSFLGTIPNNLIVDADKGLKSLLNEHSRALPSVKRLEYKSQRQVDIAIDRLSKNVPQLEWVECFSVDTISELHKRGLQQLTEAAHALNSNNNQFKADTDQQTENNERVRRMVSALRDLNRHVVITAHSQILEPKNKPTVIRPDFSEKLTNALAAIVDVVAYVELVEGKDGKMHSIWRCNTDGIVTAKNRIGLPDTLTDPTWDELKQYAEKHKASQSNNIDETELIETSNQE